MFALFQSPGPDRLRRVAAIVLLAVFGRFNPAFAHGGVFDECLKGASTQTEVNDCAASSLKAANAELERVYGTVLSMYKDDPAFIDRLKRSQKLWRQLLAADFAMMYPHTDERGYYGSAFGTCAARAKAALTRRRVEFLKQWIKGTQDGDLCAGSRKMPFQRTQRN